MVPTQSLSSARFQLDPTQLFCIRLKSNNGSPTILHHINMSLSSCPVHSLAFRLSVGNAIMVGTWILHHRTYCHCTYVLRTATVRTYVTLYSYWATITWILHHRTGRGLEADSRCFAPRGSRGRQCCNLENHPLFISKVCTICTVDIPFWVN